MFTDIEIAQHASMLPVTQVAKQIGLSEDDLELYGKYKAKINSDCIRKAMSSGKPDGKLILVTAINPTPAGEGKTTTSVGLSEAFGKLGLSCITCLREPSLGPVFGIKGGAAGAGYAQVVPMEDLNLHFTGDMHAITSANNLLCALIDNHIHHGNALGIDPAQIVFKRCEDMNDRALRRTVCALGGKANGLPREDGFCITVASEVMAILCLATDLTDLKERFSKIVVAYTFDGREVTAGDLNAQGAMTLLMKDAIKPNLVQTVENTPVLIHGGPFANIAHGCNSVIATTFALKTADYVITEAGFGADLGMEKFFDIKCRAAGIVPSAVVLVATVRALKYNGGVSKADLNKENIPALKAGFVNLKRHLSNIRKFGVPVIVAINHFPSDTEAEISCLEQLLAMQDVQMAVSNVYTDGGSGGTELAEKLLALMDKTPSNFDFLYPASLSLKEKIQTIAHEIYGASEVVFMPQAEKMLSRLERYSDMPVCMAKTQYSLSDDPTKLGDPSLEGFTLTVKEIRLSAGAGFIVALTGDILTMPGLPAHPAAENIDIYPDGTIVGLF